MKNKTFEELKIELYQYFDFEKVHKAMIAVNWVWSFDSTYNVTTMRVPTLEEIKQNADNLLETAYQDKRQIGTGGLFAGFDGNNLYLSFIFESFDVSINQ